MVITENKYYCDCCNKEISSEEHRLGAKVGLILDLDNPDGGCGERTATYLKLCYDCSKNIGVVNNEEYHSYTYSAIRLNSVLKSNKRNILKLFIDKLKGSVNK